MSEYTYPTNSATQFEGPELEPDWEWAKEHYAKALRRDLLAEYEAQGVDPPGYLMLNRTCAAAAEAQLGKVQS